MLSNKERCWIDKHKKFILFLAELEEKGVDVWAMMDITENLIKLHDRSKQANFDLVALTTFIVEQRSAERPQGGCDYANREKTFKDDDWREGHG